MGTQYWETVTAISGRPMITLGPSVLWTAQAFLEQYDLIPALHKQLVYSNAVINNKTDLQSEDRLNQMRKR